MPADRSSDWDKRLWFLWAFYNALGYTIVLAVVWILTGYGLDIVKVAETFKLVGTLVVAGGGALLYGTVLGSLQWLVVRERVEMPRRTWVMAAAAPAVLAWAFVVVPTLVSASGSDSHLRVAYTLAVSQALALGPLIGFSQAVALRSRTRRWKWWTLANIASWLIVDALSLMLSLAVDGFDFTHGEGTPLEAYLMLILAAPISGRWFLWVTAPKALVASPRRMPTDRESDAGWPQ